MEFSGLIQRALDIRQRYAVWEQQTYGRPWTEEEIALGLMGDVGDLAKLIQAHNGVRHIPDAEQKLAHELSDCLWSIIVLAQSAGVDLESAFLHTMDDLERHLTAGQ
jgi:NTP pyrophosphatase (non-canonical NTP hydrolase)